MGVLFSCIGGGLGKVEFKNRVLSCDASVIMDVQRYTVVIKGNNNNNDAKTHKGGI